MIAVHTLEHVALQIGAIAGILIGLGVIGKAATGLWKFIRNLNKAVSWLEEIYNEFRPNKGKSLKDTIDRLDRNVATNHRNIESLYAAVLKALPQKPVVDLEPFGLETAEEPPT